MYIFKIITKSSTNTLKIVGLNLSPCLLPQLTKKITRLIVFPTRMICIFITISYYLELRIG
jgi:hypothetical protein